ncbi:MAG: YfcE family phosphodiesterase [Oscillospiraceae bacterium]|nr:YfcE family phosphodiesterase [Oscillospiraceae bacterium]
MRILVCSDSHGAARNLMLAVDQQPAADCYVFLGDGLAEAQLLRHRGKPAYLLRGNCDGPAEKAPLYAQFELAGQRIFAAHGHIEQVKWGLDALLYRAQEHGAQLCLFGHTHAPFCTYCDGVTLFNPGSLRDGLYGFADLTAAGVVCQHVRVREVL